MFLHDYIQYFSRTRALLDKVGKRGFNKMLVLTVFSSAAEVIGLAMIVPVIYLIKDTAPIHTNRILSAVYEFTNAPNDMTFILYLMLLMTLVFLLRNLFTLLVYYLQAEFAYDGAKVITGAQFDGFVHGDVMDYEAINSNFHVRNIAILPREFGEGIILPVFFITQELFVVVLITAALMVYNIKVFALLMITIVPVAVLLLSITKSRVNRLGLERYDTSNEVSQQLLEVVNSKIDIRLFRNHRYFRDRILDMVGGVNRLYLRLSVYQNIPQRIIELLVALVIVVLFIIIVMVMGQSSNQLVLALALFATAAYRLMPSIDRVMRNLFLMRDNEFIFDMLYDSPDPSVTEAGIWREADFRDIEFSDIYYQYPGQDHPVLKGIDLEIPKGSLIGINGTSGSGKTTLLKVMLRLIHPESGVISVDGDASWPESKYQSLFGYVPQDVYLLDTTVLENIAFGMPTTDVDAEQVRQILDKVQLSRWLSGLKDGLQSRIGELGKKLSGGQKQRMAIARALYKGAGILILDEATSALDVPTEQEILLMIRSLVEREKLTVIVVSHRDSVLRYCDRIYTLEDGRLLPNGN